MSHLEARTPPHSTEAEHAVLGSLLLDNRAFDAVADVLAPERFYFPEHAAIYTTMSRLLLASKPADVVTVFEAGGHDLSMLNALAQSMVSVRNARRYAEIVAEHWHRRELQRIALDLHDELMQQGSDGAPSFAAVADAAAGKILALCGGAAASQEPIGIEAAAVRFVDQLNAMADGQVCTIRTGLSDVDEATAGGGRPGELWVIGARPSMGKSAFVQTVALNVSRTQGVLMLTQEDSVETWVSRAVANLGRVNLADLRNPLRAKDADRMWTGVAEGVDDLPKRALLLDDQGGLSLADVRRKAKQAKRKLNGNLSLVIVDYLQLMSGDGDNRNQMLGHIANGMKALAKELGVWVILLSQLSRKADETSGLPQVSHLRDSGDIEGAADTIGLLHRESQRKKTDENKHWAQLHLAKQKNGPTCTVNLHFDGAFQRFTDWEGSVPMASRVGKTGHGSGGFD